MNLRLPTALLLALAACDGGSASGDPGFETGPCIEGECFDGLECLSDLCVGPEGTSSDDNGGPGSGPTGITDSGSGQTSAGSSDSNDSASSDSDPSASSATASATNGSSDTNDTNDTNDTSDDDSTGPGVTAGDDTTTSGDDGSTSTSGDPPGGCGDGAIDAGEQCDGNNLQGFNCSSLGLGSGTLACDPVTCTFDTSMCGSTSGGTSG